MKALSRDYLRWTLSGRPSLAAIGDDRRRHEQALLNLGYFQRHDFILQDLSLDRPAQARLRQMVSGSTFTNNLRMTRIYPEERMVRVTACPGDMKVIERIIGEFQMTETEKNAGPSAAPNGGSAVLPGNSGGAEGGRHR